jgi:hypothetical protein
MLDIPLNMVITLEGQQYELAVKGSYPSWAQGFYLSLTKQSMIQLS